MTDLLAIFVILFAFAMMSQAIETARARSASSQSIITTSTESILNNGDSVLNGEDGILSEEENFKSATVSSIQSVTTILNLGRQKTGE